MNMQALLFLHLLVPVAKPAKRGTYELFPFLGPGFPFDSADANDLVFR